MVCFSYYFVNNKGLILMKHKGMDFLDVISLSFSMYYVFSLYIFLFL